MTVHRDPKIMARKRYNREHAILRVMKCSPEEFLKATEKKYQSLDPFARSKHEVETYKELMQLKEDPEKYARKILRNKQIHTGALVSWEHAVDFVDKVKDELGDNLLGAFVYGGVARGLKDDKLPEDIDLMFILKSGSTSKLKSHPRVDAKFYTGSMYSLEELKADNEESAFKRRLLVLPILCLHGCDYVSKLREIAHIYFRFEKDMNSYIEHQMKKRLRKYKISERSPELCRNIVFEVKEELGLHGGLLDSLWGHQFVENLVRENSC